MFELNIQIYLVSVQKCVVHILIIVNIVTFAGPATVVLIVVQIVSCMYLHSFGHNLIIPYLVLHPHPCSKGLNITHKTEKAQLNVKYYNLKNCRFSFFSLRILYGEGLSLVKSMFLGLALGLEGCAEWEISTNQSKESWDSGPAAEYWPPIGPIFIERIKWLPKFIR